MLAYHLAMLNWSAFISLTSGYQNSVGSWHHAARSRRWWLNSVYGVIRSACAQHGHTINNCRFVIRTELSELQGLLHVHVLLWTGANWSVSDCFRFMSLWRRSGNGCRHCTPYDSRLAGESYICKGLEIPDLGGLVYELNKTYLIDAGALMADGNTFSALRRKCRNNSSSVLRKEPSAGVLASTL